jgi:hypothetical protein
MPGDQAGEPSGVLGHTSFSEFLPTAQDAAAARAPDPWRPVTGRRSAGRPPHIVPSWALVAAALVSVGAVAGFALGTPPRQPVDGPSTTVPPTHLDIVAPTVPTTTLAPRTTPTARPGPAPALTASPPSPTAASPCTLDDLAISVTTDAADYGANHPVTIPTIVAVRRACLFTPVPPAGGTCPITIAVLEVDTGSRPVWPTTAERPECRTFTGALAQPGSTYTVTYTWDQTTTTGPCCTVDGGPHTFQVEATWGWDDGSGQPPASATVVSGVFSIR